LHWGNKLSPIHCSTITASTLISENTRKPEGTENEPFFHEEIRQFSFILEKGYTNHCKEMDVKDILFFHDNIHAKLHQILK